MILSFLLGLIDFELSCSIRREPVETGCFDCPVCVFLFFPLLQCWSNNRDDPCLDDNNFAGDYKHVLQSSIPVLLDMTEIAAGSSSPSDAAVPEGRSDDDDNVGGNP